MVRTTRNSAATMEPSDVPMFVTDNNNAKAKTKAKKAAPASKKKITPRKQKQQQKKESKEKKVKSEPLPAATKPIVPHMDLSLPFATKTAKATAKATTKVYKPSEVPAPREVPCTKTKAEIEALEAKFVREQDASHKRDVDNFAVKLHKILEASEEMGYADAICWHPSGRAFQIIDRPRVLAILHDFGFKHSKWDSFQRQLNHYQFRRTSKSANGAELLMNEDGKKPEGGIIYHEHFLRGRPLLAKGIKTSRRKRQVMRKAAREKKRAKKTQGICTETAKEAVLDAGVQPYPTSLVSSVAAATAAEATFAPALRSDAEVRMFDMNRLSLLPTGLSSSVSAVLDYCNRFVPNMVEGHQSIEEELRQAEMEDAAVAPTLERHSSNLSVTSVIQSWSRSIPPAAMVTPEKNLIPIAAKGSQVDEKELDAQALVAAASLIMARHEKMAVANMLLLKEANSDSMEPLPVESTIGSNTANGAPGLNSTMAGPANNKAPTSREVSTANSVMSLANTLAAESAWVAGGSAAMGGFSVSDGSVTLFPHMTHQEHLPAAATKSEAEKKENHLEFPSLHKSASCGSTGHFHIDVNGFFGPGATKNISIHENDQDDVLSFNSDVKAFDVDDQEPMPLSKLVACTSIGSVEIDGGDTDRHGHSGMHPGFYTLF